VLFSEPKIPQTVPVCVLRDAFDVSVLFSEPKIPQSVCVTGWRLRGKVSVLFSEPKIPQIYLHRCVGDRRPGFQCSSASRKFLKGRGNSEGAGRDRFQCSSASRKFLKSTRLEQTRPTSSFSALQRAENSSNSGGGGHQHLYCLFQCSSASRKFLKRML